MINNFMSQPIPMIELDGIYKAYIIGFKPFISEENIEGKIEVFFEIYTTEDDNECLKVIKSCLIYPYVEFGNSLYKYIELYSFLDNITPPIRWEDIIGFPLWVSVVGKTNNQPSKIVDIEDYVFRTRDTLSRDSEGHFVNT